MNHDFDRVIDRRLTESNKWHKYPADVLPLWVADMDFRSPEPVLRALTWQAILVANFLAAGVIAGYFWLRHPTMQMRP